MKTKLNKAGRTLALIALATTSLASIGCLDVGLGYNPPNATLPKWGGGGTGVYGQNGFMQNGHHYIFVNANPQHDDQRCPHPDCVRWRNKSGVISNPHQPTISNPHQPGSQQPPPGYHFDMGTHWVKDGTNQMFNVLANHHPQCPACRH